MVSRRFAQWLSACFAPWRRRAALSELQGMVRSETSLFNQSGFDPLLRAEEALTYGDRELALRIWHETWSKYPDHVRRQETAVRLTISLGLHDEAEEITRFGMNWRPSNPAFIEGHAAIAEARGDYAEALQRWKRVTRKFPTRALAFIRVAACLLGLGRNNEAEAYVNDALRRFPGNSGVLSTAGEVAEHCGEWDLGLARWTEAGEDPQYHAHCVLGRSRCLENLGRWEEAEALLTEARYRYPLLPEISISLARYAARRQDWGEATTRWARVLERWPDRPEGYAGGAEALKALGGDEEAAALLKRATA